MKDRVEQYAWVTLSASRQVNSRFEVPVIHEGKVVGHENRGPAEFLRISDADGGLRLEKFDGQGRSMGDYWFEKIDDAKHQADYLYGTYLSEWHQIPESVTDVTEFFIGQLRQRRR